ncbi:MAG: VWA domain-containing protein [Myxococcota bacterium]|nr:VWA domain-containing protein [Myxococcota bacterium]
MRFADPFWLFGTALSLVVAVLFVAGGFLLVRAVRRFGDEALVLKLVTGRPGGRRALKAGLVVGAVGLAFLALARPEYGRGTRLIPATNLDVVVVLDYSKSMHARDVSPSRTLRAKTEVARLIQDLPGARFGAVAFAGQPMSFPLTSDGAAIAQFFRQLTPNDMPVGGTAIARALEAARDSFARDPLSKKHKKVILLVTDGEDLEGDPVSVAKSAAADEISIFVVQVGGRTPEPIPEVDELGRPTGIRKDESGAPLTTSLSAAGEEQLTQIASSSGGQIVRSEGGKTGIEVIAARLRGLMTEELSERVETVYADVYHYPLLAALLLLLIETFVNETPPREKATALPPPAKKRRKKGRVKAAEAATIGLLLLSLLLAGCSKQRSSLFERKAPPVENAIAAFDAGDAGAAVTLLQQYLSTGKCEGGEIGVPDSVRERPNASFDLGLGLFQLAEKYGKRFGEEDDAPLPDGGSDPAADELLGKRSAEVDCALRIVRSFAGDPTFAPDLRARALYLAGNLDFLRKDYKTAVQSYDAALKLLPGLEADAGDTLGRDAAHNRSIALRRIQEEEDKKKDQPPPDAGDQNQDQQQDQNQDKQDKQEDQQDGGAPEQRPDAGPEQENAGDQKQPEQQEQPEQDGGAPPPQQAQEPPSSNQDERILEQLEQAPTVQEHDAKNRALTGRVPGMEDK